MNKIQRRLFLSSLMVLVGLVKCVKLQLFSPPAFSPLFLLLPGRKRCCHPHICFPPSLSPNICPFLGRRPSGGSGSPHPLRLINTRYGTSVRQCLSMFLTHLFIHWFAVLVFVPSWYYQHGWSHSELAQTVKIRALNPSRHILLSILYNLSKC